MGRYRDRTAAGRVLAEAVRERGPYQQPVVLALPRGGVPVAVEVAAALSAPLAVVVVRKIGAPGRPELAIGALARVGAAGLDVPQHDHSRGRRGGRPRLRRGRRAGPARAGASGPGVRHHGRHALADADVVLVDDGLATGSTMLAAVAAVRGMKPARVVVAVPVAPASALQALRRVADAVVCPLVPAHFVAVGVAYADFAQLTDDDVRGALTEHR